MSSTSTLVDSQEVVGVEIVFELVYKLPKIALDWPNHNLPKYIGAHMCDFISLKCIMNCRTLLDIGRLVRKY